EADKLEYRELTEDDPNFFEEYQIYYEQSRQDILEKLEEIKAAVENGDLRDIEYQHINSLMFGNHLYQPLLYLGEGTGIEVKPVALNQGEREFVEDLKLYYENTPEFFERKELYLLRNRSRGHGIGFFEAGNFYPDFIMWLVDGDTQHVTFIDPKGIGRVGIEDPKIKFFETIKALEKDLGDKDVQLHSFIISNTPLHQIPIQIENMSQADWEAKNVLFQVEDKASYVRLLFPKIISSSPS
ncbi:MAG: DEAD/DEAH box helicase, partial [Anaerolineae bacterium]|nr:DEAD/DEAH box helicase [Anaerolineae bacterium]